MKHKTSRGSPSATEERYRSLFGELAQSGQSLRAFAAERGLSAATLYAWRRKLGLARRRGAGRGAAFDAQPHPRLIEVGLRESGRSSSGTNLVLYLFGRHRIEVPAGFAEDDLRRLVRSLSAC